MREIRKADKDASETDITYYKLYVKFNNARANHVHEDLINSGHVEEVRTLITTFDPVMMRALSCIRNLRPPDDREEFMKN